MTQQEAIEILKRECYMSVLLAEDRDKASLVNTAIDTSIKALESTMWIFPSERLPKDTSEVLVTIYSPHYDYEIVRSGWYASGLFMNDNGDTWKSTDKEVIAWMYKPKPYRKRRGEE